MTQSPEWKPIKSAPKNWVPVLVWAISETEQEDAEGEDREPQREWLVAEHSDIQPGTWWLVGGNMQLVYSPTAWLPLPPPPTPIAGESK